ncbi:uncharacterized protein LOC134453330 [Engraulis encrasicolus]|uniref:uncharacterized protein LOC134453330 n=1 Tax=Engraulis encrasicolus TaxID=184585 RepID=UPI002FD5B082
MSDHGDSSRGPVEEPHGGHGDKRSDAAVKRRMNKNVAAESIPMEKSRGVLCKVCPERAFKSCVTCMASFCEEHVKMHYILPALQKHQLVEATEDLGQGLCLQHHPPFELFCKTDQTPVDPFPKETLAVEEHLIRRGSLNCYQLPTKKSSISEDGNIRRRTFGAKDSKSIIKTILLVGETGAGKTTLLNTMVNYMLGVEPKDRVWFEITEDNKKSQTESQTAVVTVYDVFVKASSLSLQIIDTPGYGSTGGIEFDLEVAESLLGLFRSEDGVHEITAVGLVVKAGQNHLTDHQTYVLSAIMSLFGQDIGKSIVPLITHSDGMSVDNVIASLDKAAVPYAKDSKSGNPVYFMFNNRQSEAYEKGCEALHWSAWDLGYHNMELFLKFLYDSDETQVRMTEDVLRERKGLEAHVSKLKNDIEMEEGKQNELQQIQKALEENKNRIKNNENFTFPVEETFMDKAPIDLPWFVGLLTKKAMCCTTCEENCHYPGCWWVKDLSRCGVMKDGRCTVCRGKCPVSDHVKEKWFYKPKKRLVRKNSVDLRKKYGKQENIAKNLEKEINESKVQMKDLLEESYDCILKLEDIALKKDSMCLLIHLDFLIEKMKEMEDEEKVKKLEEIQNRNSDAQQVRLVRMLSLRLTKSYVTVL